MKTRSAASTKSPCDAAAWRLMLLQAAQLTLVGPLALLLSGCEAVPTLTFEGDDGGGGAEAGGQCPMRAPQNATCCGTGNTVPCLGNFCSGANCTTACARCNPPDFCCSKNATTVNCQAKCP